MYRLTFKEGPLKGRRLAVRHGAVLFGRGAGATIALSGPDVAERHARLEERADGLWITEVTAGAGLRIDGRLVGEARLTADQTVRIGLHLFSVETVAAPPPGNRHARGLHPLATTIILSAVALQLLLIFGFTLLREATDDQFDSASPPPAAAPTDKTAAPADEKPSPPHPAPTHEPAVETPQENSFHDALFSVPPPDAEEKTLPGAAGDAPPPEELFAEPAAPADPAAPITEPVEPADPAAPDAADRGRGASAR